MCALHHERQPGHLKDNQRAPGERAYRVRFIPIVRQNMTHKYQQEDFVAAIIALIIVEDSHRSDYTQFDTEPDTEHDDISDATGAGLRHRLRTGDEETRNQVSPGRVSMPSGSHAASLLSQTPARRGHMTPRGASTLPVLPASSVA